MKISIHHFPWQVCKALAHFASTDRAREALRSVLMEVHESKLIFCATDGWRLMAMVYFEAVYEYESNDPFIVRLPAIVAGSNRRPTGSFLLKKKRKG